MNAMLGMSHVACVFYNTAALQNTKITAGFLALMECNLTQITKDEV